MVRTVTLGVFIVIVIGAVFLGSRLWHTVFGGGSDYSGDGKSDVVIQIHEGDSTTAIGQTLEDHEVVATSRAFVSAAEGNAGIQSIQPGFYKMRTEIPAANAVARLTDAQNRWVSLSSRKAASSMTSGTSRPTTSPTASSP